MMSADESTSLRDPNGNHVPFGIRRDDQGVLRIGKTRITLETLLEAYFAGLTVEQILDDYPTLTPADVLASLAVYEADRSSFGPYLSERRLAADVLMSRSSHRNDLERLRAMHRRAG